MYVVRDKEHSLYLSPGGNLTSDLQKARVYLRIADAKNSANYSCSLKNREILEVKLELI